ncbi:MAG: glycosyltransferase family 2 protein [Rhodothermales bacterium]|nr:glycosyltransferase family 2 protein [Rhodothermales bacterium]
MPDPDNWRQWSWEEYVWFFLSREGARRRIRGSEAPLDRIGGEEELVEFCRPVRERIRAMFDTQHPRISITLVAYNEERQLIPTLMSYARLECPPGLAELVVVDNNSSDRTKAIIEACGARHVLCTEQGTPFARRAGLKAAYPEAEYLWMSDADVRVGAPLESASDLGRRSTILKTSYDYLESHPRTVGVSSGGVVEEAHWLYKLIHRTALLTGRTLKYSCWAGYNQFVRKWALEASGGVDTTVLFGEDHHRHYQLARWAKENDYHLSSANMDEEALADPVYISGRRYATFRLVAEHVRETLTREHIASGDDWTDIKHQQGMDWRHIR